MGSCPSLTRCCVAISTARRVRRLRSAAILMARNYLSRRALADLSRGFGATSSGFLKSPITPFKGQTENAGHFLQPTAIAIGQSVIWTSFSRGRPARALGQRATNVLLDKVQGCAGLLQRHCLSEREIPGCLRNHGKCAAACCTNWGRPAGGINLRVRSWRPDRKSVV